jgi:hypothetical protein
VRRFGVFAPRVFGASGLPSHSQRGTTSSGGAVGPASFGSAAIGTLEVGCAGLIGAGAASPTGVSTGRPCSGDTASPACAESAPIGFSAASGSNDAPGDADATSKPRQFASWSGGISTVVCRARGSLS